MGQQRDYTGNTGDSNCAKCMDPAKKDCICEVEFSFSKLFEVLSFFFIQLSDCDLSKHCCRMTEQTFCLQGPVFFYYGLSNYYQNFRSYGVSIDPNQLVGETQYLQV